jgi:hypothetical protein
MLTRLVASAPRAAAGRAGRGRAVAGPAQGAAAAGVRIGPSGHVSRALSFSNPAIRKLGDIVKLPLLERESAQRVREIWLEYHKDNKLASGAALSEAEYETMLARTKRCPYFVLPVWRNEGHFMLVSNFQGNWSFLAFLEDYKRNPATALPYLVFTMYADLLPKHGGLVGKGHPVLVRGEVCHKELTKHDCDKLTHQLVRFYTDNNDFRLVEDFNLRPSEFDFQELLRRARF